MNDLHNLAMTLREGTSVIELDAGVWQRALKATQRMIDFNNQGGDG